MATSPGGRHADGSPDLGFRVASAVTLVLATDLPPSRLGVHPSGVRRAAALRDVFVWVDDALRIQAPLERLVKRGYDRCAVSFLPYSSRENWRRRHAPALALEDAGGGQTEGASASKPRKNMLGDETGSLLGDLERDELHLEMWNYFRWLHAKLVAFERMTVPTDPALDTALAGASGDSVADEVDELGQAKKSGGRHTQNHSVNLSELQCVVDKLEVAFAIIPNVKFAQEAAGDGILTIVQRRKRGGQQKETPETLPEESRCHRKAAKETERPPEKVPASFLEE